MIKEEARQIHFASHAREMNLAQALDESFDVTSGKLHESYSIWSAEPKEQTKQRFGLTKEVLVAYSKHDRQDARLLSVVDDVLSRPPARDRYDQTLVLIIHEGDAQQSNVLEDGNDRVVIAIPADALVDPQRPVFFVRTQIARRLGRTDLFGVSSPIRHESKFFGRAAVAEELAARLFARHENAGIFGLRKTGKTSLMRAVERRSKSYNAISVYLDCENPGLYQARWWTVLEQIVRSCAALAGKPEWSEKSERYSEADASNRFHSDLRGLVEAHNGPLHFAVLLDEIEYITPGVCGARAEHWDADFAAFWQTIRSLYQETPEVFTFCVAGVNPACVDQTHFSGVANPLFQLASPVHLDPLSTEAVRQMVRTVGRYTGLRFDESVYPYLRDRFGGHAFLIRLACSEVWRSFGDADFASPIEVSVQDFHGCHAAIKGRLAQPVKDILLSLVWWYPDEYDLLRVLAEGDREFFRTYMAEQPESMVQFARYGLVNLESGEFKVPELRDFLVEAGARYRSEVSPFLRSEIPPTLLPQLPDIITLGELFKRKIALEVWLRRLIVAFLGVRHAFNTHKVSTAMLRGVKAAKVRRDPSELFIGRLPQDVANELYTSELAAIITENWDDFSGIFESKSRFAAEMGTINAARRVDAHSKPVEPTDYEVYIAAYDWIRDRLQVVPKEFLGAGELPPL